MIEAPLLIMGGLLGSAHCVGMCGGFALTVGIGTRGLSENLRRQLLYSLGRVGTYAFFGLGAGSAGFWLQRRAGLLVNFQAVLCIAAGLVLGWQGLRALGWLPGSRRRGAGPSVCLAGSFLGPFLAAPRGFHVFLAGIINGFLPCGLVYGYLALASSTASLVQGLATMALFGLGTVPIMVLTGAGASLWKPSLRRQLLRSAAWCVLFTGLFSIGRGVLAFQHGSPGGACPACAVKSPRTP